MKYLYYFLIPIIGFLCIYLIYFIFIGRNSTQINLNQTAVVKQIQSLDKLETSQFTIEKVVDAHTGGNGVFQQLLFGDKILLIAHGEVIAGVDLSKILSKDIQINDKTLTITLPKTQILLSKLDNEKTQVYDRTRGLLAPVNKDLESQTRNAAENSIRTAACEEGILQDAATNAQKQISSLFKIAQFTNVIVHVEAGTCS